MLLVLFLKSKKLNVFTLCVILGSSIPDTCWMVLETSWSSSMDPNSAKDKLLSPTTFQYLNNIRRLKVERHKTTCKDIMRWYWFASCMDPFGRSEPFSSKKESDALRYGGMLGQCSWAFAGLFQPLSLTCPCCLFICEQRNPAKDLNKNGVQLGVLAWWLTLSYQGRTRKGLVWVSDSIRSLYYFLLWGGLAPWRPGEYTRSRLFDNSYGTKVLEVKAEELKGVLKSGSYIALGQNA